MDSLDRATNDQSISEGTISGVGAPLEERIPARGTSNVDEIGEGSSSMVATAPLPPPKLIDIVSSKRRPLNQMLLSTYIPSYERIHPSAGMVAPDLEGAQKIIHRWSALMSLKVIYF